MNGDISIGGKLEKTKNDKQPIGKWVAQLVM